MGFNVIAPSSLGSSIDTTEITDLTIVNADVSASAAIVGSKLDLTSGTAGITASGSIAANKTGGGKDQITLSSTTAGAGVTIGADTNLYRSAAGTLKTDGSIIAVGDISTTGGGLSSGSSITATYGILARSGTNQVNISGDGVNPIITFGSAEDTNLYRGNSNQLKTDDALMVVGNFAANGATPAARPDYTTSNVTTDRAYDANSTSIDEVADVLGTVIADLIAIGLFQ